MFAKCLQIGILKLQSFFPRKRKAQQTWAFLMVAGARAELSTALPAPFPTSFSLVLAQSHVCSNGGGPN
jgi:hypothetical protein